MGTQKMSDRKGSMGMAGAMRAVSVMKKLKFKTKAKNGMSAEQIERTARGNREIQKIVDEFKKEMEKENQSIDEIQDTKDDLNKQFEVRRAAVQAKAAEIAAMEAEMKKRIEAAQAPADDSETTE